MGNKVSRSLTSLRTIGKLMESNHQYVGNNGSSLMYLLRKERRISQILTTLLVFGLAAQPVMTRTRAMDKEKPIANGQVTESNRACVRLCWCCACLHGELGL